MTITEDVLVYFQNRVGSLYCDVCLIHKDDSDLGTSIHIAEKVITQKNRRTLV